MKEKNELPPHSPSDQQIQLIVFKTGDEEFCVEIDAVQEIIKIGNITPIPDSAYFMKGLINVRGDIVVIIDVKTLFSLPDTSEENYKHIIITKQPNGLYGLMVSEVLEVLRVQQSDINTTPSILNKIHDEYVTGIVRHDDRLIILLDLTRVLSQQELIKISDEARKNNHVLSNSPADIIEKPTIMKNKRK